MTTGRINQVADIDCESPSFFSSPTATPAVAPLARRGNHRQPPDNNKRRAKRTPWEVLSRPKCRYTICVFRAYYCYYVK